ncbi:hypothetical protein M5K25_007339 [Dendrobium thyrsiflorum]|uniref:Uncharacterized protein n=1 Tax=Dendrobium thyrsiflorum TaxID=117978 RepID=A0ABD0VEZ5_DENTH
MAAPSFPSLAATLHPHSTSFTSTQELAHRQQYFFWKNYRNNRLKHIAPRPLPEPAVAPLPTPPAPMPPMPAASAPTLPPMQVVGQPGSAPPKVDMRNSMVDRRKRNFLVLDLLVSSREKSKDLLVSSREKSIDLLVSSREKSKDLLVSSKEDSKDLLVSSCGIINLGKKVEESSCIYYKKLRADYRKNVTENHSTS